MDIFSVLSMLGGLALFLYGMSVMGDGLSKVSGGRLEKVLEKLTSNPIKAVLLGAGVTAVIQSSSATTVMVVGFVNSGIMKLSQAVGIIMGANIGTTVTSWILSLSGIESSNVFIKMLKPTSFSPVLAMIGVIFLMFSQKDKKKDVGMILIGFAVLMFGMESMSGAVKPLADVPQFTNILTMFSNPILGLLAGAVLTAIIQSSSASVGILQALCVTGSVTYATAIPIIMGQNIGTCVTAMISSVGASKNAKRTALVHLYFNMIGTITFMVLFYGINVFANFTFMTNAANAAGIAVVHSVFNVFATLILLPFSKVLEKLAYMTIRESEDEKKQKEEGQELNILDPRFLDKPGFAIEQAKTATIKMTEITKEALVRAMNMIGNYTVEEDREIMNMEDRVDRYEDALGSYLLKISSKNLSVKDSQTLSILLHCIGDFERISDHAVNIAEAAKEMNEKNLKFSDKAAKELKIYQKAIEQILDYTVHGFANQDGSMVQFVEPLEEVIDGINDELKIRHVKRLREGTCTIELGFILSDITTCFERISDHCSNIAVCVMQVPGEELDTHFYLHELKNKSNENFQKKYAEFKEEYILP